MNKILKVALTAIPATIAVSAPITLLSSCKEEEEDIQKEYYDTGISYYSGSNNYAMFMMKKTIANVRHGGTITVTKVDNYQINAQFQNNDTTYFWIEVECKDETIFKFGCYRFIIREETAVTAWYFISPIEKEKTN